MTKLEANVKIDQLLNALMERTKDEDSRLLISEIQTYKKIVHPDVAEEAAKISKKSFEQAMPFMVGKSTLDKTHKEDRY